jgi:hypothetical protein
MENSITNNLRAHIMKNSLAKLALSGMLGFSGADALAATVATFGSGSAVTSVINAADFELNTDLISGYTEGGMVFSYNGSDDNNSCGYAGCEFHSGFYPGFSDNYMFTKGADSFISIKKVDSSSFTGIEFAAGSGYSGGIYGFWETYKNTAITGSGSFFSPEVVVLGLYDPVGFDEVHYTSYYTANLTLGDITAGAIDTVRAGAQMQPIPEPSTLALLVSGLLFVGWRARRKS